MHSKYVTFGRIYLNLNGRSTMKAGILIITGPVPVLPDLRILKLAISYCIVFIYLKIHIFDHYRNALLHAKKGRL